MTATGVLAVIPARGGSKGIPDKNIRLLAGQTLVERAAYAAAESGLIDRTILSTDSERIAEEGRRIGLEVPFIRPAHLAADDTPIHLCGPEGVRRTVTMGELLPLAFGRENLKP